MSLFLGFGMVFWLGTVLCCSLLVQPCYASALPQDPKIAGPQQSELSESGAMHSHSWLLLKTSLQRRSRLRVVSNRMFSEQFLPGDVHAFPFGFVTDFGLGTIPITFYPKRNHVGAFRFSVDYLSSSAAPCKHWSSLLA